MSDVLVVMVHLYETMPDPSPNILWKSHCDALVELVRQSRWPVIYQLDYIDKVSYDQISNNATKMTTRKLGGRWEPVFGDMAPNKNITLKDTDLVSTSNIDTRMFVESLDPKIVLFGGLHKDRCVEAVKKDLHDHKREYLISDLLSYTWKDTWQDG